MPENKLKFLVDVGVGEKVEIIRKILHEYEDKMKNRFCVFQDGRLRISR